jgi:hypothetical protein
MSFLGAGVREECRGRRQDHSSIDFTLEELKELLKGVSIEEISKVFQSAFLENNVSKNISRNVK